MTTSSSLLKAFNLFAISQTVAAILLVASFHIRLWPFEIIVSFTNLALIILLTSLAVSTLLLVERKELRSNRLYLVFLGSGWIISVFALIFSLNIVQPIEVTAEKEPTITFVTFNKYYGNTISDGIPPYLKQQDVDVLALQETQPEEVKKIAERLGFKYSFSSRKLKTAVGTVTAITSRYPIESAKTINLNTDHPVVRAVISTPKNGEVVFYAVHLPVPLTQSLYDKRNKVTVSLTDAIKKEKLPVVIGGDFNTANYSPSLRAFDKNLASKIRPVASKRWPSCSWYGFGSSLCVRIDHIYIPKNAKLTNITISPDLGSDHRAVIATIELGDR